MKNVFIKPLFKFNRSITGENYWYFKVYKKKFKYLEIKKFKSGSKVFDWKIPKVWKVKTYIKDNKEKKL